MLRFSQTGRFRYVTIGIALIAATIPAIAADKPADSPRLRRAHAHNDYWHERPLFDALEQGFFSVEADVFLVAGNLLVGHDRRELTPDRTLEALYLKPLQERISKNRGAVYPGSPTVYLLIDVKSDAGPTWAAIDRLLANYAGMLSTFRNGSFEQKAVTVVISGNRDEESIRRQTTRYAGLDGRAADLDSEVASHLMPWVSDNWNKHFRWRGEGAMPDAERSRLQDFVRRAHARGRLVRFWGTPENETVWQELLEADVDLIGTDDLNRLGRFLARVEEPGE